MIEHDPNQALLRNLRGIASDLKWSAVELMRIAERLRLAGNDVDAQAVLRLCMLFREGEIWLDRHAQDIDAGLIQRISNRNPKDADEQSEPGAAP